MNFHNEFNSLAIKLAFFEKVVKDLAIFSDSLASYLSGDYQMHQIMARRKSPKLSLFLVSPH